MDIAKQREEFELEKLTPLDGRDHLGLVMAFPMPKQQELAAAISIMNDFVDGAVNEGYKVLLINNTLCERQPIIFPKPVDEAKENLHNIFVSWMTMPTANNASDALQVIKNLVPQYDFIILGTGGSAGQGSKNGLLSLDLCEAPYFFDITSLVDRFVFHCAMHVPEKLISRSVTYANDTYTYEAYTPLLAEKDDSTVSIININKKGKINLDQYKKTLRKEVSYQNIRPVICSTYQKLGNEVLITSHDEPYCKIIFGAILGIVPEHLLYVNKETLQHYHKVSRITHASGSFAGIGSYVTVNGCIVYDIAFGGMDPVLLVGSLGLFAPFAFGISALAHTATKSIFRRKARVSQLNQRNPMSADPAIPMIESKKDLDAIGSVTSQSSVTAHISDALPFVHTTSSVKKIHKQSSAQYHAIRERWLDYELDVVKFLDAPLMRDLSCETTAQFFMAMHRSQTLEQTINEDPDFDVDIVKQFEASVAEMHVAFERAEAFAKRTGSDMLAPQKQKDFETAAQMLLIAHDDGASPAERVAALKQGRKILSKTVNAPPTIYGLIEGRINMIGSASIEKPADGS